MKPTEHRKLLIVGLVALALAVVCFASREQSWIQARRQARQWLEQQPETWFAPSLPGAPREAAAPWQLRLLGEPGVLGIGMDVDQFAGPVPYPRERLVQLFPEARVDFSRGGRFIDDPDR
jgi:hypothetical protein